MTSRSWAAAIRPSNWLSARNLTQRAYLNSITDGLEPLDRAMARRCIRADEERAGIAV